MTAPSPAPGPPDYGPPPIPKRDYGIGIIGTGWVVRNYHLPAYREAGFRVVAVADLQREVAESVAREWGVPHVFTDYRQLLDLPAVQIVDVSVPAFGRLEIVRDTAQAGKHLLVQKPLTRSYAEGVAMVEAAEKAGVRFGVNSHYRWLASVRATKLLLDRRPIGEPFAIVSEMHGNQDHLYYHKLPQRRWNATLDDFMTVEWGAHHFDYLRFWTGREPVRVTYGGARMPGQNFRCDMFCTLTVEFEGGLQATVINNQVCQAPEGGWRFRVYGSEGVVEGAAFDRVGYATLAEGVWHRWEVPSRVPVDSYIGVMGDLMNAITEGREHISGGRDNLRTTRAYLAADRSRAERRPVLVEEIA